VSVGMSLVINTTLPFERIASVYAGLKEIKSNGSSSKSSSKTDCCRGMLFSKRGSFSMVSHAHTTGGKREGSLRRARSRIPLPPAFPGPALSNGASLGLRRNRIGERLWTYR
jgi:hypothetical protein